jgi:uncharacterized protein YjbI with pentapeptide repeats
MKELSRGTSGGDKIPEVQPDLNFAQLSEANLFRANLSAVDLRGAHLMNANLYRADLRAADLSEALLGRACLSCTHLSEANLTGASLNFADLSDADLRGAHLRGANLSGASLRSADLRESDLYGADLTEVNLGWANLSGADLRRATLTGATLLETNLEGANLTGCRVYGTSTWNVRLEGAVQSNLVITPLEESPIEVDNLEVAQFIYLLLNNEKIRSVVDTITSKVALVLGRFTPERKPVLDAVREVLRKRDYLPVLFDFAKPASQTTVETISTLAHMARFVIADLTDAKSVLQELQAIVPLSPSVVVQPLLLISQEEPGMFDFIRKFSWVLEPHRYTDQKTLLGELPGLVIAPAEAKAKKLALTRQK